MTFISVPVDQKSGHNLAGFYFRISHRLQSRCQVGLQSSQGSTGEGSASKPNVWLLAGLSSLWAVRLSASISCRLLVEAILKFLAVWTFPQTNSQHGCLSQQGDQV